MRLEVTLEADNEIAVPIGYNHLLSSLIYSHISASHPHIHETGFPVGKRNFKLFTFSRLMLIDRYSLRGSDFLVKGKVSFFFATPVENMGQAFARSIISSETARLGSGDFRVASVRVLSSPEIGKETFARTLSPVTMYSTLTAGNGRKKTYYYSPFEKEFSTLLQENARKKYSALTGNPVNALSMKTSPIGRHREMIINYKGTIVKGWMGIYKLEGDPELISIAYDSGLGSKNSEGFGCFETIREGEGVS